MRRLDHAIHDRSMLRSIARQSGHHHTKVCTPTVLSPCAPTRAPQSLVRVRFVFQLFTGPRRATSRYDDLRADALPGCGDVLTRATQSQGYPPCARALQLRASFLSAKA
jgi:hypothetical protein